MRKIIRKLTSILLAAVLLLTSVSFAASAATIDETKQSVGASSGTTGACTWTLDDDGTLTISGNGAMGDYSYKSVSGNYKTTAPWGYNITSVVIEDGVMNIGKYAFSNATY